MGPVAPVSHLYSRGSPPRELSQVKIEAADRSCLPMAELNRVLGGGLVSGSLVLVGGEPGIGKSTLLLQIADIIPKERGNAVYVSGEETEHQIKLRADRLGIKGNNLYLMAETDLEAIFNELEGLKPGLVLIDSIQTMTLPDVPATAGSITQVKECALRLLQWSKQKNVPVFMAGHVTKGGAIAGPRVLEHMVDVVLYFEGAQFSAYRLLRCVKNRFGSTNEVGVFEMGQKGLLEVANPSEAFLSDRGEESVGSAVVPVLEGNRPLLVEVQSLSTTNYYGIPRRVANGIDFNRLLLLAAVLTKRAGLKLSNQDIMVNVAGGLKIEEPAADLGISLSIASSFRDAGVKIGMVAIGEIGLSGELRSVPQIDRRLSEAARLGFRYGLIPRSALRTLPRIKDLELIPVGNVREAIQMGLVRARLTKEPEEPEEGDSA
jgi:DNA repair protein RadA/Sms